MKIVMLDKLTRGAGDTSDSTDSASNSGKSPKSSQSYQTDFFKNAAKKRVEKQIAAAIKEGQRAQDRAMKKQKADEAKARKTARREANKKQRINNFASSPTGKGLSGAGWGALKFGGKTIRGAVTAGGRFIGRNGVKFTRFVGRNALKGVGAATLGTIGLAAGLASGNDADIIKYAGLGLTAGAAAAGQVSNSIKSLEGLEKNAQEGINKIEDDFANGFYGDEYEDKFVNPRLDKEWSKDEDIRAYYRKNYGTEWRQKMKDSLEIRKHGLTDQGDIDKALELNKKQGLELDKSAQIVKFAKDYDATKSKMIDSKHWNSVRKTVEDKVSGGDEETVKKIMKYLNINAGLSKDFDPNK